MIRTVTLMTLALLLAPAAVWSVATAASIEVQQEQPKKDTPPWTVEEYRAFYAVISKPTIAAMEQFVSKYPQSALVPLVRRNLVLLYFQSQKRDQAFKTAEAYFSSDHPKYAEAFKRVYGPSLEPAGVKLPTEPTEDFQILYTLVDVANKVAKANDKALDHEALKYSRRALAVASKSGAPPTIPPQVWNKNRKTIIATLHQTIGVVEFHRERYDDALASLKKASELNATDPATFFLTAESFRVDKYAKARERVEQLNNQYTALTDEIKGIEERVNEINNELEALSKRPPTAANKARIQQLQREGKELADKGKEQAEQVDQLSEQVDQQVAETDRIVDYMIEVYAKTYGLLKQDSAFRKNVRKQLESYYEYRHQGKLTGLTDLIERMKTDMPRIRPMVSTNVDSQGTGMPSLTKSSGDEKAEGSNTIGSPNPQPLM